MTYHLDIDKTIQSGVRAVVRDQVDKAISSLNEADDDLEEAIHDARKRFKKLRALARLLRPGLGNEYAEINTFFRDLGRELSDVRDAQVLTETFEEQLVGQLDPELHAKPIEKIRAWLDDNRKQVLTARSVKTRVESVRDELKTAPSCSKAWKLGGDPTDILRKGLKKTYRRGSKALAAASLNPDAERLHEWRKRVKYHWYHCRLLRDAWPGVMRARADALDDLSDLLGDEHDLAVLIATARCKGASHLQAKHLRLIENVARPRQEALREQAFRLGPKVFWESPRHHAARLSGYWTMARATQV